MMTSTGIKAPFFRTVATRSYGQAKTVCNTINCIKTSQLPNKLTVASAESTSPIVRVSVAFRAGSRYEVPETRGSTHMLRIAAGLSTANSSHFAIVRNIQQSGASLTCTTTREIIAYTLEGTCEGVERSSEFLSDVASCQVFKPWEISDSIPRLKLELANVPSQVRVVDLLHIAAYRTGLGNSLFCPLYKVGKISPETLQHYYCENFVANRAAVVGIGIGLEDLTKYAKNMNLRTGAEDTPQSKYHGGEIRYPKGGDLAYVAIGTESAPLSNDKEALAFSVLQFVFGAGPVVKYGTGTNSLFSKALQSENAQVSAINVSYTDSGLFGALVIAPGDKVNDVVKKTVKALRSSTITEKDLERAKNQLITRTLLAGENLTNYVHSLGMFSATVGQTRTPQDYALAVNSVTLSDVNKALNKIAKGKLSIASVGKVSYVPYLDELQ